MTPDRTLRVHVPDLDPATFAGPLAAALDPAVQLVPADAAPGFDVLVAGRPAPGLLAASRRLRLLVVPYAGVPAATIELLRARPHVALSNLHHNAAPTAELAVALLLAAGKRLVPIDAALRRHDWTPRYAADRSLLLAGRTALIVGFGAIGRRVGAACRGLGMRVVGVRRQPAPVPAVADGQGSTGIEEVGPEALDRLLPCAAALVLCVPTTAATRGLIGARELARLPDGAVLVNVARGEVVDENALHAALASGRIAAGLDVWYRYPAGPDTRRRTPPAHRSFESLDNVVMSPHRAGHCADTERLRAEHLARLLNAVASGAPPPNRVDLDLGY
ncbi:MAG: NAD(P)-dependent oxidoreductase [Candidatus Eiseniibacteriota bacterium]|jgi:phosphoglycerate dehydrogenase-like enzyme